MTGALVLGLSNGTVVSCAEPCAEGTVPKPVDPSQANGPITAIAENPKNGDLYWIASGAYLYKYPFGSAVGFPLATADVVGSGPSASLAVDDHYAYLNNGTNLVAVDDSAKVPPSDVPWNAVIAAMPQRVYNSIASSPKYIFAANPSDGGAEKLVGFCKRYVGNPGCP
jgi:hypothetical protein